MTDVPPSDEVIDEEQRRQVREEQLQKEAEEAEQLRQEIEEAIAQEEADHLAQQQQEYEDRIAAAKEFDWDSWEEETGLKRPEIG